jgi:hypothetical protein
LHSRTGSTHPGTHTRSGRTHLGSHTTTSLPSHHAQSSHFRHFVL